MYSPTAGSCFTPGLERLLIATISDALAGVCDTPHGSTCQRVASADFFSALPANYENFRNGLVNTPQRPTSRRSSCYQKWPSLHIRHPLPTSWHVSSCMHAGFSCPRGLSPSETAAGICFCDPTPQLSQTHSLSARITIANCLRCIAGTGLEQHGEAARITARRNHGPL